MASIWCKDILKVWRFSSHSKVGRCTICTLSGKIGEEAIHSGEAISMPCRSLVMLARTIQFCIAFDSSYLDPSLPSRIGCKEAVACACRVLLGLCVGLAGRRADLRQSGRLASCLLRPAS